MKVMNMKSCTVIDMPEEEEMTPERVLPKEMWVKIMTYLSVCDLCRVALVSRHMYMVASHPSLWAYLPVSKKKVTSDGIVKFFSALRFSSIKRLDLSNIHLKTKHTTLLLTHTCKRSSPTPMDMDLTNIKLTKIAPNLLAEATSHLHKVTLKLNHLTTEQLTALLTRSLTSSTLSHLELQHADLSRISPDLLSWAVARLIKINLSHSQLTAPQAKAIFTHSLTSHSLTDIDLDHVNLSHVSGDIIAKAIARLTKASLPYTRLNSTQLTTLLQTILTSTTLTSLSLRSVKLAHVSSDLLTKAISGLKQADLSDTSMTIEQCESLCTKTTSKTSSTLLEDLSLRSVPLSRVPADLLAQAVIRLNSADLSHTYLTRQHVSIIFTRLLQKQHKNLRNLNLSNVDLSRVLCDNLGKSISELESADLSHSSLTGKQCKALLTATLASKTLSELNLERVGGLPSTPPDLIAKAVTRLKKANLSNSNLTSKQCTAILEMALTSTTLEEINLKGVCLKQVPEKLISQSKPLLQDTKVVEDTLEAPYLFMLALLYIGIMSSLFYCIYTYL